jgi:hypothetical protein
MIGVVDIYSMHGHVEEVHSWRLWHSACIGWQRKGIPWADGVPEYECE